MDVVSEVGKRPQVSFTLQNPAQFSPIPEFSQIKAWMKAALAPQIKTAEITLRLVDEIESQGLNQRYRQKDKPTNIISLDYEGDTGHLLGDLIICGSILRQEAKAQNKPFPSHFAHLVVHGMLHLQGEDHQTPAEAQQMEQQEIAILAQFNFPNPYKEA